MNSINSLNSIEINEQYNGITINASFNSKLNILVGDSGTGKTLLLSAIDLYCLNNNISCRLCNYNDANLSPEQIKAICAGADILLLDNADLYMNNSLLKELLTTSQLIILNMKDTSYINTNHHSEQYIVDYINLSLTVRKI